MNDFKIQVEYNQFELFHLNSLDSFLMHLDHLCLKALLESLPLRANLFLLVQIRARDFAMLVQYTASEDAVHYARLVRLGALVIGGSLGSGGSLKGDSDLLERVQRRAARMIG